MIGPVLLLLTAALLSPAAAPARSISLSTLEGVVMSVQTIHSVDDLDLMAVELRNATNGRRTLVLLAPQATCREIGFEATPGDRLRAPVFGPVDATATAQQVLNLSRETTTRFRTLTGIPFWTNAGVWRGGLSHSLPGTGPHGTRHRRVESNEAERKDSDVDRDGRYRVDRR